MCEIAVLDPERASIEIIQQVAYKFHEEQGDGLGILAVKQDGEQFDFERYCSTDPHWPTVYGFLRRELDDTWRVVVHGRYKTAGAVNRKGCHPIGVDCDACDWDFVVHNGSVRKHKAKRGGLASSGHSFNTKVDSEVIAHTVRSVPETVEDHTRQTYELKGNLNYLLFSEDGILVRVSQKYGLTDDFIMTCSYNDFEDAGDLGFEKSKRTEWMLIEPSEDGPEIETKDRQVWNGGGRSSSRRTSSTSARRHGRNWPSAGRSASPSSSRTGAPSNMDAEEPVNEYTVTYEDHCERFDHIIAIKVAPGVMRIIEKESRDEEFVFRDRNPRLYYWYAPDPEPDNIDKLEEYAEAQTDSAQASLDQYDDELTEVIEEEVTEHVMQTAKQHMEDGVTIGEVAEVEETVREAIRAGNQAIEGAIE